MLTEWYADALASFEDRMERLSRPDRRALQVTLRYIPDDTTYSRDEPVLHFRWSMAELEARHYPGEAIAIEAQNMFWRMINELAGDNTEPELPL